MKTEKTNTRSRFAGSVLMSMLGGFLMALAVYAGWWGYHNVYQRTDDLRMSMRRLSMAIDLYYQDCKTFPSQAQGLGALEARPEGEPVCANWDGPYATGSETKDPWGRTFIYERSDEFYSLKTLGADGAPGGAGLDMDLALEDL